MVGLRGQILIDRQGEAKYTVDKNTNLSALSEERALLNMDFAEINFGKNLVYGQIDTTLAELCFGNILITLSVRWKIDDV